MMRWLDERTGLPSLLGRFFNEEIPASCGWPQVFGSVALFLFLTQAFTGILLALNYAPTPGEAYNSVRYIVTEVTGGRLIRGLHHWGASLMIVVVVLHMVQVFLFGAYKKPREATWLAGVFLLVMTLAYGLTGYLLPWDNRAYWGTVVVTRIASTLPFLGGQLSRLLGGSDGVGVVTFARFYAVHVLLLPPATALLIAAHVYLVRRHGITPAATDTGAKVRFFPRQVFKDTAAIFAAFAVLFVMAAVVEVPLGRLADPTDTKFVPRPDWYFLFLFQTLKLFEGPLEVFGSAVLPGAALLALVLVPFLDRGKVRRWTERTVAWGTVGLAAACWAALTVTAVLTTPGRTASASMTEPGLQDWRQLNPTELAGIGYFRRESCSTCHNLGPGPAKIGPNLGETPVPRTAAWLIEHFKRPGQLMPGTAMPAIQLNDRQLSALAAFLLRLRPENTAALASAPDFAVEGAMIYESRLCASCHVLNGTGTQVGPNLNGLASRRTREWIEQHFVNPQALSPGSVMPPYRFTAREMDRIVTYLLEADAPR